MFSMLAMQASTQTGSVDPTILLLVLLVIIFLILGLWLLIKRSEFRKV